MALDIPAHLSRRATAFSRVWIPLRTATGAAAAAAGASVWPESLAFDAGAADAANVPCSPIPS